MSNMTKEYGAKKGKSVFYATANAKNMNPSPKKSKPMDAAMKTLKEGK